MVQCLLGQHILRKQIAFFFKLAKKNTFFFRPFTSEIAYKISPITLSKIYLVFNKLDTGYVLILDGIHREHHQKYLIWLF